MTPPPKTGALQRQPKPKWLKMYNPNTTQEGRQLRCGQGSSYDRSPLELARYAMPSSEVRLVALLIPLWQFRWNSGGE
eukprot:960683-Amphidinium_carterae.1